MQNVQFDFTVPTFASIDDYHVEDVNFDDDVDVPAMPNFSLPAGMMGDDLPEIADVSEPNFDYDYTVPDFSAPPPAANKKKKGKDKKKKDKALPEGIVDLPEIEDIPDVSEPNFNYDFTVPDFSVPTVTKVETNQKEKKGFLESSSEEESSEDKSLPQKTSPKAEEKPKSKAKKSALESSSEEQSSESPKKPKPKASPVTPAKKAEKPAPKKKSALESSSEEESSGSSLKKSTPKATPPKKVDKPKPKKAALESSSEEDSSEESSKPKKTPAKTTPEEKSNAKAKKSVKDSSFEKKSSKSSSKMSKPKTTPAKAEGKITPPHDIIDLPEIEDISEPTINYDFTVPDFSVPSVKPLVPTESKNTPKKEATKKKKVESSSEESSSEAKPKGKGKAKPKLAGKKKPAPVSSSDEESTSEEKPKGKGKPTAKAESNQKAKGKADSKPAGTKTKVTEGSSSSEEESTEEAKPKGKGKTAATTPKGKATAAAKVGTKKTKKVTGEDSEDETDSIDMGGKKKGKEAAKRQTKKKAKESSSEEDGSSEEDDDSDDGKPEGKGKSAAKPPPKRKETGSTKAGKLKAQDSVPGDEPVPPTAKSSFPPRTESKPTLLLGSSLASDTGSRWEDKRTEAPPPRAKRPVQEPPAFKFSEDSSTESRATPPPAKEGKEPALDPSHPPAAKGEKNPKRAQEEIPKRLYVGGPTEPLKSHKLAGPAPPFPPKIEDGGPDIAKLLFEHSSCLDTEAVDKALTELSEAFLKSHHKTREAVDLGGHGIIVVTMKKWIHHKKIQKLGCECIHNLIYNYKDNRVDIFEALAVMGALEQIVFSMDKFPESLGVQKFGLAALGNLLYGKGPQLQARAQHLIKELDALTTVVGAMRRFPPNTMVQGCGCIVLAAFLKGGPDFEATKSKLVEVGALLDVAAAVTNHSKNPLIAKEASAFLKVFFGWMD